MNGEAQPGSHPSGIALVTDSTADIPYDMADQHHIHVVANVIMIDGESVIDGKDISREQFYERLPRLKSQPTTGTASPGAYQELYERLLQQGAHTILSIHTSSRLSGIINAASTAAEMFGNRVHVIDSGSVSMGLGLQVLAIAEALAAAGQNVTLEAALGLLEDMRQRVRVIAMLETLEYVRRSGRVSWARARLGELLNIKPLIEVKAGQVLSLGEARTHGKAFARLQQSLRDLGPLERMAVLHTNAEAEAGRLLAEYGSPLSRPPLLVHITTVIGTHVGPGCLGIAALVKS